MTDAQLDRCQVWIPGMRAALGQARPNQAGLVGHRVRRTTAAKAVASLKASVTADQSR